MKANFFGLMSDSQLHTVVSQLHAILLTAFMLDYGSFLLSGSALFWFLFTCIHKTVYQSLIARHVSTTLYLSTILFSSRSTCLYLQLEETRQRNVTRPLPTGLFWISTFMASEPVVGYLILFAKDPANLCQA